MWIIDVSTFLTVHRMSMCILPATVSVFILTNGTPSELLELLVLIPTIHKRHPELSGICAKGQSQLHG